MSIVVGDVQFVFRAATIGLNTAIREINRLNQVVRGYGSNLSGVARGNKVYAGSQTRFTRNTQLQSAAVYELVKSLQIMLGPLSGVASRVSAFAMLMQSGGGIAGSFLVVISGLTAGLAFLQHQLVKNALAMQALSSRFNAVGLGGDKMGETMEFVTNISRNLGLNLQEAAASYSKLAAAAQGTALEGQGVKDIFIAVSEASAAMRLSTDQTTGAFKAIEQMMSKGTIQAEELRGQLGERIFGAFQRTARAVGVTTKELGRMLKAGDALADEMLPKLAKELHTAFGLIALDNVNSLQGSLNSVRTEFTLFLAELDKTSGVTRIFAETLRESAVQIREFTSNKESMEALAHAVGFATESMIHAIKFLINSWDELLIFIAAFTTSVAVKSVGSAFIGIAATAGPAGAAGAVTLLGVEITALQAIMLRFLPVAAVFAAMKWGDNLGELAAQFALLRDGAGVTSLFGKSLKELQEVAKDYNKTLSTMGEGEAKTRLQDSLKLLNAYIKAQTDLLDNKPDTMGWEGVTPDVDAYAKSLENLTTKYKETYAQFISTRAALQTGFSKEALASIADALTFDAAGKVLIPDALIAQLRILDSVFKKLEGDKTLEKLLSESTTEAGKLQAKIKEVEGALVTLLSVPVDSGSIEQITILQDYLRALKIDLQELVNPIYAVREDLSKILPKEAIAEIKGIFEETRSEAEKFAIDMDRLDFWKVFARTNYEGQELIDVLEAIRRKQQQLREESTAYGKGLKEMTDLVKDTFEAAGKGIADAFITAFSDTEKAMESLADTATNIAKQIMNTFLKLAVINPMINSIFGGASNWQALPAFGGGAMGGGIVSMVKGLFGMKSAGATGGSVGGGAASAVTGISNAVNGCCCCNSNNPVAKTIQSVGNTTGAVLKSVGKTQENAFYRVGDFIGSTILSIGSTISNVLSSIGKSITQTSKTNQMIGMISSILSFGSGGSEGSSDRSVTPVFAAGGSFKVGGVGGTDSKLVRFMGTPGERVTVTPPGGSMGGSGTNITIEINAPGADEGTVARIKELVKSEVISQVIPASYKYTMGQLTRPRFV